MRRWLISVLVLAALAGDAFAGSALKIAGLTLGMPGAGVTETVARYGFAKAPPATKTAAPRRDAAPILRFQRPDGHRIEVQVEGDDPPRVHHLSYRIGEDADSRQRLFEAIRAAHGPPHAEHGTGDGLRVLIWEIARGEMTAEGVLATSIVLTSDPVTGHALTMGEVRKRPLRLRAAQQDLPRTQVSQD